MLYTGAFGGLGSKNSCLEQDFEGLSEAAWWQQLAREQREASDEECEWGLEQEEPSEEAEPFVAGCEAAAQAAMKARCGTNYGRQLGAVVGRRTVGIVDKAWGSTKPEEPRARRSGRRLRGQPQQALPAAAAAASAVAPAVADMQKEKRVSFERGGKAISEDSGVAHHVVLKGNRFVALAQDGSEEDASASGPPVSSEAGTDDKPGEETPTVHCFTEETASAKLEEQLKFHLSGCPDFSGTVREAASLEIAARIGWLTELAACHECPNWRAVVAREYGLCEDAMLSLRR